MSAPWWSRPPARPPARPQPRWSKLRRTGSARLHPGHDRVEWCQTPFDADGRGTWSAEVAGLVGQLAGGVEFGRALCREGVCQYVENEVDVVLCRNKNKTV